MFENIDKNNLSDMFKEYISKKEEFPNEILLYRVGDFYETYFEDAILISNLLGLTLTSKKCGSGEEKAAMAGVPQKSLDEYVKKLILLGYKVAIGEQLEDPKNAKGRLVKRDVVKVVTSSTYIDDNSEISSNNYLCSISNTDDMFGISFADIVSGEIYVTKVTGFDNVLNELARYQPVEILLNDYLDRNFTKILKNKLKYEIMITVNDDCYSVNSIDKFLKSSFRVYIENKILKDNEAGLSLCALIKYINYTQRSSVNFDVMPVFYSSRDYMDLDIDTRNHLELVGNYRNNYYTLFNILNKTNTTMGSRLLKQYIEKPLVDVEKINLRLDGVQELFDNSEIREDIKENLKYIYDLSRILGRLKFGKASPKDLSNLKISLKYLPEIKAILSGLKSDIFKDMYNSFDELSDIKFLLDKAILDDPSNNIKDGDVIKEGYNKNLDNYRDLISNTNKYILNLENNEKNKTGIKNLRISNIADGYFFEVTNSNIDKVPDYFMYSRKLTNLTRFKTEELNKLESDILSALEKGKKIEIELFEEIQSSIINEFCRISSVCNIISVLDVLNSFAEISVERKFNRPHINDFGAIVIEGGRHPVVEAFSDKKFISNDTLLDKNENNMLIITGPNMAGKSTYMRQVALISILAQIGCFVPADRADLCIVDKIFTRIGASDDISSGKSTFMVEMEEVHNILSNATDRSLVVLDEVGRGTSTFDGLAIAQALIEYIIKNIGCKTLFATHYHELVKLEERFSCIKNYHIKVDKKKNDLVFLRKIVPGGVDESYGIDVANLAGLPDELIKKARLILDSIENEKEICVNNNEKVNDYSRELDFIKLISQIDLRELGPVGAYQYLDKLISESKDILGDNND